LLAGQKRLLLQADGDGGEASLEPVETPSSLPLERDMTFLATLLQLVRWAEPFDLEVD